MKEHNLIRRQTSTLILLSTLAMLLLGGSESAQANDPMDILVIANNSVAASKISQPDLVNVYLGRRTELAGSRVVPLHSKGALRDDFVQRALRMDPNAETAYWEEEKIKSGAKPPRAFGNPLKAVFSLKGAIGYCYRKDYREGVVKVLMSL